MSQALSPARASLALFRGAYPNATITDDTLHVYERALRDLEAADIGDAVSALIKESKFMPTIAEIREVVAEYKLALPQPSEAWEEARERSFGTWTGVRHPLVHKAIQAQGGTYMIKTSEKPSTTQAQFLKHYKELRADLIQQFVRTGRVPEMPEMPASLALVEQPNGEYGIAHLDFPAVDAA